MAREANSRSMHVLLSFSLAYFFIDAYRHFILHVCIFTDAVGVRGPRYRGA